MILEEVRHIMKSGEWCRWGSYDTAKTPMFTCMSTGQIRRRLTHYGSKLGDSKSWKLYGLILFGERIDHNCERCA
jgi:hypothetical protein